MALYNIDFSMLYEAMVYNTFIVYYKISANMVGIVHCCIAQCWLSMLYKSTLYDPNVVRFKLFMLFSTLNESTV